MEGNTEYKPFALIEQYNPNEGAEEYYNTLRTLTAAKNDCPGGTEGSSVELTALANTFISAINIEDANQQAESWLNANIQAYANNIGVCTLSDITFPTAPSLEYSDVFSTSLNLLWTSSADNIGVVAYDLYKDGILLASKDSETLNCLITGLSESTSYTFYVQAKDAAGNTSNSNTVNVTTSPAILILETAKSVIFENQESTWESCRNAAEADYQYSINKVIGSGVSGSTFYLNRFRGFIDTSLLTRKPKSAKIKFLFSSNPVNSTLTINLFFSNTKISVNQPYQLSDWNDWDEGTYINKVDVPAGSTMIYNEIPLTSNQIDFLRTEQTFDFFLISNGDRINASPSTNSRPELSITGTAKVYLECKY